MDRELPGAVLPRDLPHSGGDAQGAGAVGEVGAAGGLGEADEQDEARAEQRRWAAAYAVLHGGRLTGPRQFDAIDAIDAEENNLADELRDALADGDNDAVVQLLAALGTFWAIRGDHGRMIALSGAIGSGLRDWSPPPELADHTRAALAITLTNTMIAVDDQTGPIRALLEQLGPGTGDPRLVVTFPVELPANTSAEQVEQWLSASGFNISCAEIS